ncbi:expressed unknown protein [Seminavis robusta]|uniref:Uncharacterized protein n=1 Tax=Seminavis robusta TaxID=568900 RepID=A0A9N8E1I4_9STRA|nr:expressed unknown protein [Seminavis robusta]|eukprot:Sro524_g160060.1 n/a (204) ;mRNA; f:55255-55866
MTPESQSAALQDLITQANANKTAVLAVIDAAIASKQQSVNNTRTLINNAGNALVVGDLREIKGTLERHAAELIERRATRTQDWDTTINAAKDRLNVVTDSLTNLQQQKKVVDVKVECDIRTLDELHSAFGNAEQLFEQVVKWNQQEKLTIAKLEVEIAQKFWKQMVRLNPQDEEKLAIAAQEASDALGRLVEVHEDGKRMKAF